MCPLNQAQFSQNFNLIPYINACDNLAIANYFVKKKTKIIDSHAIFALLKEFNIASESWNKPVCQLSIGQQQRVAIARALINQPKIIIADEPTSSLDKENSDNFIALLMEISKTHNISLVFVSHDLSLSHYFDDVYYFNNINNSKAEYKC